jgi:O-succinylbenzoic acid--CoA ligase
LWVVDRRTDLIVTGGENVYPSEVERVLLSHPGVREACVVGVPDAEWGQKVAASIVASDANLAAETLIAHCRKHLAGYKIPKAVYFVSKLPQTASGKVKRQEIAILLQDEAHKQSCA